MKSGSSSGLVSPRSVRPRAARVVLRLISILSVAGAYVACVWRPDFLAAMTVIPAWLLMVPFPFLLVLTCRAKDIKSVIVQCLVWAVFGIGWVEELRSIPRGAWGALVSSKSDKHEIRVVSFNCDSNVRCAEEIARIEPDIVLLQESPGRDTLQKMVDLIFAGGGEFISSGDVSILTRGRIQATHLKVGDHFISGVVSLPGRPPIECVCLRLSPPVARLDFWSGGFWTEHQSLRDTHRQQLRDLSGPLTKSSRPLARIVGGDFNMPPLDRAFSEINDNLSDAFLMSGTGWGATGTSELPLFRVDQIWVSRECQPQSVYALKSRWSDHRCVVCQVRLSD